MGDAADRREARRKRILENSENRVRIISGLTKVGDSVENIKKDGPGSSLPVHKETEPTVAKCEVPSISPSPNENQFCPPEEVQDFPLSNTQDNHVLEPTIPVISESMGPPLPQSDSRQSILYTLVEARLYLVGLAIIVRLLLSSNHGYLFGDSIFVPLFTIQLVKYFGFTTNPNSSAGGIISGALMLCGMSSRQINFLSKTMGFIKDVLTDFHIYFITFIMMHVLLEVIY